MTAIAQLSVAALDCPDPLALARFYSRLTGWPVRPRDERDNSDWVQLVADGPVTIACQRVTDYREPEWPGQLQPQQAHLDFNVPDLDVGERQVLAIGGRKAAVQPGTTFRVYLDPAGHPFCLVRQ
jgi:predicted enzyme related to lactoylglutathione lyase